MEINENKLVFSQYHLHISSHFFLIRLAREIHFLVCCFYHASAAFKIKNIKTLNTTGLFSYIVLMAHLMQDVGFPMNDGSFVYSKFLFFFVRSSLSYLNIGIVQQTRKQRNKFSVKYSKKASISCSEQMYRWEYHWNSPFNFSISFQFIAYWCSFSIWAVLLIRWDTKLLMIAVWNERWMFYNVCCWKQISPFEITNDRKRWNSIRNLTDTPNVERR